MKIPFLGRKAIVLSLVLQASWGCDAVPAEGDRKQSAPVSSAVLQAELTVDASTPRRRVPPLILGNNLQWVDKADELWDPQNLSFNPLFLQRLQALRISSLRFPGGTMSDVYHWRDGVGPAALRKPGMHVFRGTLQESHFGTEEFLALCRLLGAEPVVTVNAATGTPEEAADWVRFCQQSPAARVRYWEIGNEPYLAPSHLKKKTDPNYPEEFARRFVEFARAMRAADPSIQVGLPLRSDLMGRHPGTPYPGWNRRILPVCAPEIDFVCLHNAYFPGIFSEKEAKDPGGLLALLAAPAEVQKDIERTRALLKEFFPSREIPIAVTEYNTFFALPKIPESRRGASLASGLYTASLLVRFSSDPAVFMAHFWSLTGNWIFGALSNQGKPRPQFYVLKVFSDYTGEEVLSSSVLNGPTLNSPAAGYMPQVSGVEALDALATRTGRTLFLILVNRSPDRDVTLQIRIGGFSPEGSIRGTLLTGPRLDSDNEQGENVTLAEKEWSVSDLSALPVPRHSVLALRMEALEE